MTEEAPVANPMEMVVTTNTAPVEQKSPEMVTTEPKTDLETPVENTEVTEKPIEPKDNDLAREKFSEKIRADDLQRQLDEAKPKDVIPTAEPDINNYKTLDEYKADYKKWAKEEGKREERETTSKAEQAKDQAKVRAEVARKGQESRAKHSDFDTVVRPLAPVMDSIPILRDFVEKNPMGTEVAYELAKNPAILEQLTKSDLWAGGELLLNMAARLKKPVVAAISNAPEPIKPVGSRETVKPRLAELASKDINGYMAKRNKDELAKRRAN